jgi:hypothetical protein
VRLAQAYRDSIDADLGRFELDLKEFRTDFEVENDSEYFTRIKLKMIEFRGRNIPLFFPPDVE